MCINCGKEYGKKGSNGDKGYTSGCCPECYFIWKKKKKYERIARLSQQLREFICRRVFIQSEYFKNFLFIYFLLSTIHYISQLGVRHKNYVLDRRKKDRKEEKRYEERKI